MQMKRRSWRALFASVLVGVALSAVSACLADQLPQQIELWVYVDGASLKLAATEGLSVEQVLEAANIGLGLDDRVYPSRHDPVFHGMGVKVVRVRVRQAVEEAKVPYTVTVVDDVTLRRGLVKLDQGTWQDGRVRRQVVLYHRDDGQTERAVLQEVALQRMLPKVIRVGTGGTLPSRAPRIPARELTVVATGYYPGPEDCGPNATGYTCLGLPAGRGIVAVDPDLIPLGTRMFVPGYGWAVAGDTGRAIQGNRIDLGFDEKAESQAYGTQTITIQLFE